MRSLQNDLKGFQSPANIRTMQDSKVENKRVVFLTGVSRGIGWELFGQCAVDESTIVIGISRNKESLDRLAAHCDGIGGTDFFLFAHDLTEPQLPDELTERLKAVGRVDVLINNAGFLVAKPFREISAGDWDRCYRTNVYGPFHMVQQLYPWLEKSEMAHVVNIGSMGGVQGSAKFAGLSAYSSSKAALLGLTECLAEELKETNIRVNIVNLGAVQTEMLEEAFPGIQANHQPKEIAHWLLNFAFHSGGLMNGKSISLSDSTP